MDSVFIGTFLTPEIYCLVFCTWRLVVGVRCLVHNGLCLVFNIWRFVFGGRIWRFNHAHKHKHIHVFSQFGILAF